MDALAEAVALDILQVWISDLHRTVEVRAGTFGIADGEQLQKWREGLRAKRTALARHRHEGLERFNTALAVGEKVPTHRDRARGRALGGLSRRARLRPRRGRRGLPVTPYTCTSSSPPATSRSPTRSTIRGAAELGLDGELDAVVFRSVLEGTAQKSFYVEISRARDRAALVTGEHIAALEGVGEMARDGPDRHQSASDDRNANAIPIGLARLLRFLPDPARAHEPGEVDTPKTARVPVATVEQRSQTLQGTPPPRTLNVPSGHRRWLADGVLAHGRTRGGSAGPTQPLFRLARPPQTLHPC